MNEAEWDLLNNTTAFDVLLLCYTYLYVRKCPGEMSGTSIHVVASHARLLKFTYRFRVLHIASDKSAVRFFLFSEMSRGRCLGRARMLTDQMPREKEPASTCTHPNRGPNCPFSAHHTPRASTSTHTGQQQQFPENVTI